MKLKINIVGEKESEKPIRWQNLDVGTVFEYQDGVVGLRSTGGVFLLSYSSSDSWLRHTDRYGAPAAKILGTLTGIEVTK